jgi:hypothetical protein
MSTTTTPKLRVVKGDDGRWLVTDADGFVHSEHDTRTAARAAKDQGVVATTPDLGELPQAELVAKAKADHKAVQAARKAGTPNSALPATPYLDELNRRHAAGEKRGNGKKAPKTPRVKDPRYVQADEAKATGDRGETRKLTEAELDAYVAKVRKANPTASAAGELKVARHVEGLSVSLSRWNAAWKRHTPTA